MQNYHKKRGPGGWKGGGGFGGGSPRGRDSYDRSGDRPQLHAATCASCGNSCEVPFKPNGSRPIYCRDCFKKDESGPRPEFRGFSQEKRLFKAECGKCGDACEVPFRPTGDRPVYCRSCFGKSDAGERPERRPASEVRTVDYNIDQFKQLHAKLDAILAAISPSAKGEAADQEMSKVPVKKKTASKKKK